MTIWMILLTMTLAVVALLVRPLLRPRHVPIARDLIDREILKDQLAEVERDLGRDLIAPEEAAATRVEIARRALARDRQSSASVAPGLQSPWLVRSSIGLVVLVPLAAMALYGYLGTPQAPVSDQAATARLAGERAEMTKLVEALAAKMESRPDDMQGFRLLARSATELGRFDLALPAYRRAIELDQNKDVTLIGDFAEALVISERSVVPEARRAFDAVLSIDPKDPRARYYLAEAQAEIGAWDKAYDQWMALLRDGGDQADYAEIVQARIADAAKRLGRDVPKIVSAPPNPSPPAASPPAVSSGGPTAQDIAQAAQMGAGDRQAMIETMVARLAEKMENSPNDPAGWRKLARAYLVLGRIDPALSAYEKAQALDPKSAEGQSGLVTALRQGPGVKDPRYLPALRQLLALDPDNADALMDLGAFELGTGNVPAARDLWARLLAGWPKDAPQRAQVLAQMRKLAAEARVAPAALGLPD